MKDLQQIQNYIEKINSHLVNNVLIEDSEYIGNITVSITFRADGTPDVHWSVAKDIVPYVAALTFKSLLEDLLDNGAQNVHAISDDEVKN